MSSMWGFTKIVVEGEKAKDVYELGVNKGMEGKYFILE